MHARARICRPGPPHSAAAASSVSDWSFSISMDGTRVFTAPSHSMELSRRLPTRSSRGPRWTEKAVS